jgi:tubulin monoglycylase TTLL15
VLWAWRDPYHKSKLTQQVVPRDVRAHQLINHFPGASFTTKVDLVTTFPFPFIPRAFMYPQEKDAWTKYIDTTPGADQ